MTEKVRLGIIGFGLATGPVVGPVEKGGFEVVGCADPDPITRGRFVERFSAPTYESAEELFASVQMDAVYIATPTRLHESLTLMAFEHGANVLVEKPITTSLDAAERMINAAQQAGRVLMVNHKRSADRDVIGMWELTKNGNLGKVRSVERWHFSDWFYRARAEDERDPEGGGVVLRQGAHEFDILRLLVPVAPVQMHAWIGNDFDPNRPGEGAYQAWLECGDGALVTSIYNGYDRFQSEEFTTGLLDANDIGVSRRRLANEASTPEAEHLFKREVGHPRAASFTSGVYGFTLMNCDGGDLRPSPGGGVYVYDETGRHEVFAQGPTGTEVIIDELYRAVALGEAPLHDGMWGLACLELCLGVRESAASGGFVKLTRQGAVDPAAAQRVFGDRELAPK